MSTYTSVVSLVQNIVDPTAAWATGAPTGGSLLTAINSGYREVQRRLAAVGAPPMFLDEADDVAAGIQALTLPTAVAGTSVSIIPLEAWEKDDGADDSTYIPMTRVFALPHREMGPQLGEWMWQSLELRFVGATTARDVFVKYQIMLGALDGDLSDELAIPDCGDAVAWWAAKIVSMPRDPSFADKCESTFERVLKPLADGFVRANQNVPHRRRAYGR